jgi:hypothetical protein
LRMQTPMTGRSRRYAYQQRRNTSSRFPGESQSLSILGTARMYLCHPFPRPRTPPLCMP